MGVRDAEVGDLDQALDPLALADQDVRRLDVAVHDPGLVRGLQRGEQRPKTGGSTQWKWLNASTTPPLRGTRSVP